MFKTMVSISRTAKLAAPLFITLSVSLSFPASARIQVEEETVELYGEAARHVARQLPRLHLSGKALSESIASGALNNFIESLDYDRTVFMAEDIERFGNDSGALDAAISSGNMDLAFEIYDCFMERLSNRVDYVENLLEAGFDFSKEEEYRWRRRDAPWPSGSEKWDDIWRRKIKHELLSRRIVEQLSENDEAGEPEDDRAGEDPANIMQRSPEEAIMHKYRQHLQVLRDNDAHWLLSKFISAFAGAYDPHTSYMSAREREDFDIQMKLSLVGIGAVLNVEDGAARIVRLIPGGPADRDGRLQAGDRIIAVGQDDEEPVDVLHWPLSRTVRLIRGEEGTRVVLMVNPASDISGSVVKKIALTRDTVELEEQAARSATEIIEREDGDPFTLGILTVPDFYSDMQGRAEGERDARSVTEDVRRLLKELKDENIDGLLLDLRRNGGGSLLEAIELTGLFIRSGPVVQVKSRSGFDILTDADPEQLYDGPLAVLVNRTSASASEIVAAALKDYDRALIIGDSKTHGKGTVQSLVDVIRRKPELGSIKVTTARFYRISGESTQVRGVTPHIVLPSVLDGMEIGEEHLPNAMPWSEVYPALYTPLGEVSQFAPELKRLSRRRLEQDPAYQQYKTALEQLSEQRQNETISLHHDTRLEIARRERERREVFDQARLEKGPLFQNEDDPENDHESPDMVLEESLNILSDLIANRKHGPASTVVVDIP